MAPPLPAQLFPERIRSLADFTAANRCAAAGHLRVGQRQFAAFAIEHLC